MSRENKFYITTAIPYVNAKPHLGHAFEFVQADVLKRYHELLGEETFLVTGSDENSLKNVQASENLGITTQQLCDDNSAKFKNLADKIFLSYDVFRRSSDKKNHWNGVNELWNRCVKSGDIYKKKYKGLYCVGCEAFYTEGELEDGLCPEHKTKPEVIEEENYFFKLSNYSSKLLEFFESGKIVIYPEQRKNEIISFIKDGLKDISISRSNERARGWGIPVPNDSSQIIYVWFDALSCYLTGVGFGFDEKQFTHFWPCDSHVIGKGISRFHTIYWPAILLSAGIEVPKSIFIHGYLTVDGQKMSKSIGNVVDPVEIINKYGVDSLRYYLMSEVPTFKDGDFSEDKLIEKINNELVANVGNLVNRILVFVRNYFNGLVPEVELNKVDSIISEQKTSYDRIKNHMDNFEIKETIDEIMLVGKRANKYFQDSAPWILVKNNREECAVVLYNLLIQVKDLSILLYPFLPETSNKINQLLNTSNLKWTDLSKYSLNSGKELNEPEILFRKIKDNSSEHNLSDGKKDIKIKDKKFTFSDFDIEVGEVLKAQKHPDADKLFVEAIKLGDGIIQVVSGLADYFSSPSDLIGKKVLILRNLKPAKIRGVISQGMLLVAEDKNNLLEVIENPNWSVGSKVHKKEEINKPKSKISIDNFFSVKIIVSNNYLIYDNVKLFVGDDEIEIRNVASGRVR